MAAYKSAGKVSTLGSVYKSLDSAFKHFIDDIIENNGPGSCLLRLLKLPETTHFLTPLLSALLDKYDVDNHYFDINGNHLNITLEDVLFVTGLPINGKAVISNVSRDHCAFNRVFSYPIGTYRVSMTTLREIGSDTNKSNKERLVAVLLIVVACFILPSYDNHCMQCCYVQFVENLEEVNDYAWGAALLAFLYCGLDKKQKRYAEGNLWALLCFFSIRIPRLCEAVGLDIESENLQAPLLISYMEKMDSVSKNHKPTYIKKVESLLAKLEDNDIKWHPYVINMLDASMRGDLPYVTRLAPVICMSYVAYHQPLRLLKQFQVLDEYSNISSIEWNPPKIRLIRNSGNERQNFLKTYYNEHKLWENAELAEMYIRKTLNPPEPSKSGAAQPPPTQPSPRNAGSGSSAGNKEETQVIVIDEDSQVIVIDEDSPPSEHEIINLIPEHELGDINATHIHDVSSGFTTCYKAAQITYADASRGERFQSSAGSKGNRKVNVSDDIHQESPHSKHEIIITAYAEEEMRRGAEERTKNEGQAISRWYQLLSSIIAKVTPEQELCDISTTHVHDVSSGFTTRSKAAQITDADASRGERFQSLAGSKGNREVNVSDDIHQESPLSEHEIIITQICDSEDGTSHKRRKRRTPQAHDSEDGTSHQKKKRTPTKSVISQTLFNIFGVLEESSSLSPPDQHGNSLNQASAGTPTDYQQDWPFIKRSPMWATIELYSQKPHFAPLKEMDKNCREGLAIGHFVTFGNLVESLSNLKPNDPADKFNDNLEILSDLETHGFDVGPIRGRLNLLLSLKTKMFEQEATRKEVVKELEKCKCEKSLVEKEMQVLKSKLEQIARKLKAKEEQLMRLQTNNLELDFEMLAATPL